MKKIGFIMIFGALLAFAGTGILYRYDAAGRLSQVTYSNGTILNYSYDGRGNMLRKRVFKPCYDFQALQDQYPQWPAAQSVPGLLALTTCP